MYNLFEKSGEPILSLKDEISLYFRTNRPEGLIFYTGKIAKTLKLKSLKEKSKSRSLLNKKRSHQE